MSSNRAVVKYIANTIVDTVPRLLCPSLPSQFRCDRPGTSGKRLWLGAV
jgi:hypothetical protein